jgi:methylenetetrahydrofolate--tRNA-(uracil-5-)-methyltransferase
VSSDLLVIGGGLAGCEAAWQAARQGLRVRLCEMRPASTTPAHRTDLLAELVCSNSLKSDRPETASGLLKAELARAGSLLLRMAERARVPAGGALAVDRELFGQEVTRAITGHPLIELRREEVRSVQEIAARAAVIATGPLTSAPLAESLAQLTGSEFLYYYDAISPVFLAESLDFSRMFRGARYEKGEPDYFNCPLTREVYERFTRELAAADTYPTHSFEEERFFGGCLPIEVMARSGLETLAHGPLRPVGIRDPSTGRRPHAVVQLRAENRFGTLYGPVGFQTRLRHGEQRRVLRLIPGLERAEFARYGSIHRNTYLCAPRLLGASLELGLRPGLFVAGSLVGAEGYVEAIGTGWLAGWNAARRALGEPLLRAPAETMLGALVSHLTSADPRGFQPMNVNLGLLPPLETLPVKRADRPAALAARDLAVWDSWLEREGLGTAEES